MSTKFELHRKAAAMGFRLLQPFRPKSNYFELVDGRGRSGKPFDHWPDVLDEAGKPVRGTLQQIVRYLEPFCPKCGENLHMDYHDAAGNCVHQPL